MITLNSLSKIYRTDEIETVALENVNLTVERGEFLSIMGPSGCGKSTLLNIMVQVKLYLKHCPKYQKTVTDKESLLQREIDKQEYTRTTEPPVL